MSLPFLGGPAPSNHESKIGDSFFDVREVIRPDVACQRKKQKRPSAITANIWTKNLCSALLNPLRRTSYSLKLLAKVRLQVFGCIRLVLVDVPMHWSPVLDAWLSRIRRSPRLSTRAMTPQFFNCCIDCSHFIHGMGNIIIATHTLLTYNKAPPTSPPQMGDSWVVLLRA